MTFVLRAIFWIFIVSAFMPGEISKRSFNTAPTPVINEMRRLHSSMPQPDRDKIDTFCLENKELCDVVRQANYFGKLLINYTETYVGTALDNTSISSESQNGRVDGAPSTGKTIDPDEEEPFEK